MSTSGAEKPETSIVTSSYASAGIAKASEALREDLRTAKATLDHAYADRTRREYAKDWDRFVQWCASRRLDPLAADVAMGLAYLGHLKAEGMKVKSVERFFGGMKVGLRAALAAAGQGAGVWARGTPVEEFRAFFGAFRREIVKNGGRVVERKRALTSDRLADTTPGTSLRAIRDRALLLVGFAGAFRRSELVAIRREHVEKVPEGLRIMIPRSKTNQEGKEEYKAIFRGDGDLCPVKAIGAWVTAARLAGTPVAEGYLFRPVLNGRALDRRLDERAVARAVKEAAASLGLDASDFAGHSLRAGFVTSAAKEGAGLDAIMNQTGHKRTEQILEYIRHETIFERNAGQGLLAKAAQRKREKKK